jgi:magnesium-transporting ATPase (P-type)
MSAFTSSTIQNSAFYHAMTLLVVASPCALVLSIPSAILAAIASGARQGVLFRGGAAVEQLAGIDIVAMDKTGTLTTGDLRVESVESFPPGREQEGHSRWSGFQHTRLREPSRSTANATSSGSGRSLDSHPSPALALKPSLPKQDCGPGLGAGNGCSNHRMHARLKTNPALLWSKPPRSGCRAPKGSIKRCLES